MNRRDFLHSGAISSMIDAFAVRGLALHPLGERVEQDPPRPRQPVLMRAGLSRKVDGTTAPLAAQQTIVRSFDSDGRFAAFSLPVGRRTPYRGAPLHLHHDVDEWIYILGGEFVAEVGGHRHRLRAGDSLLMPMQIPHRWSIANDPTAGALHLYTPAGLMDISFDPSPDDSEQNPKVVKAMFEKYNMSLLGSPLSQQEIDATVYIR